MLIWGLSRAGAINRLAAVRDRLQKTHSQSLNVFKYCQAEDITIEQFDVMMKRAQEKL